MVKKSFTLIEALIVIVILSFITIGGFQIISKIYERNYIVTKSSQLSFISQQVLDQLSGFLYHRIPLTTIGYNPTNGDFKYIEDITDDEHTVLEWIGECSECKQDMNLSGFIDLYKCNRDEDIIKTLDFNSNFINDILKNKFGISLTDCGMIFAGSFDRGEEGALVDYKNAFGWHGNEHKYVALIDNIAQEDNDANITIDYDGDRVYEKFYLADSAYAIALGKDIKKSSDCIKNLNLDDKELDNTLLLFYNYRPWKGDTFCADNSGSAAGEVSVLSKNVKAFRVKSVGSHLELLIEMRVKKGKLVVDISKQKVVF